jgi:hypothetical protein
MYHKEHQRNNVVLDVVANEVTGTMYKIEMAYGAGK